MSSAYKATSQASLHVSVNGAPEITVKLSNKPPFLPNGTAHYVALGGHEGLLIDADGKQERVFACLRDAQENRWDVWFQGATHSVVVTDPNAKKSKSARRDSAAKSASNSPDIKAPMPGTILQIKAAIGDNVSAGQTLLIMESMKMEMTLNAATAGVVKEIRCQNGQMVEMGAVLIQIQPDTTQPNT
ncbi:MAG: hypothetical protein K2X01_02080 [Cyanobacteria bacterium]|nr:hypothetical protein [Cyanobacteriota bacterium]